MRWSQSGLSWYKTKRGMAIVGLRPTILHSMLRLSKKTRKCNRAFQIYEYGYGNDALPLRRCGDDKKTRRSPPRESIGKGYADCCGRYLEGGEAAPAAEVLMRLRYAAYTLGREDYLLATWHHSTRPASLELAREPRKKWLGLDVRRHEQLAPDHAVVEFVVRYKVGGRAHRLHEVSRFVHEAARWLYVDGDIT